MTNKPENPPAFPSNGTMGEVVQEGMTLRDYFAGQAMQSLVASSVNKIINDNKMPENSFDFSGVVAGAAYDYADAMLEWREKS